MRRRDALCGAGCGLLADESAAPPASLALIKRTARVLRIPLGRVPAYYFSGIPGAIAAKVVCQFYWPSWAIELFSCPGLELLLDMPPRKRWPLVRAFRTICTMHYGETAREWLADRLLTHLDNKEPTP